MLGSKPDHAGSSFCLPLVWSIIFVVSLAPSCQYNNQTDKHFCYRPCCAVLCCAGKDLGTIGQQFPFEPLQYQQTNLRLPFEEGIKMLQEAGYDVSNKSCSKQCTSCLFSVPEAPHLHDVLSKAMKSQQVTKAKQHLHGLQGFLSVIMP